MMDLYIQKIQDYLSGYKPNFGSDDVHSLLVMLYYIYTEQNPVNSESIHRTEESLRSYMRELTIAEDDIVFDLLCDLYMHNEQAAFLEGAKIGTRLMIELFERPPLPE